MNVTAFATVVAAGFTVAFFHAATPSHWLPFVLVARVQGWSAVRTLGVTGAAGLGHSLFTALLGLAITGAGLMIEPRLGQLFPRLAGGALVLVGLYYLVRHLLRRADSDAKPPRSFRSDSAAIAGLIALMTFTPSEAVLPVYLANIGYGWSGYAVLSVVLTLGTTLGMLLFTGLFLAGADRLKLERLERYELAVVGGGLCLLGLIVAL